MSPAIFILLPALIAADEPAPVVLRPFAIRVVDADTRRGVPLVELSTTGNIRLWTDSNGIVAFAEPGQMGTRVFFHVRSHGYEHPNDGFGYRGVALDVTPGGSAEIAVRRIHAAQRLYRLTGGGIYRDSLLVGAPVPIRKPTLNALVTGSDSVVNTVYRGRILWFWGDTNRPRYPLGNFHTPGAVSELPGRGGLDPDRGVDFTYFEDRNGFARPTAKVPGDGPTWISGAVVLRHEGRERLFAHYVKIRGGPGGAFAVWQLGLIEWDDDAESFRKVVAFDEEEPFPGGAHTFVRREGGRDYVYYCDPFPTMRVPATPEALARQDLYESFTPLVAGSRTKNGDLDRDDAGRLQWKWKRATAPLRPRDVAELVSRGKIREDETRVAFRDVETNRLIVSHRGSVYYNEYRKRWGMIAGEVFALGEIWYAEADRPIGPWGYAGGRVYSTAVLAMCLEEHLRAER